MFGKPVSWIKFRAFAPTYSKLEEVVSNYDSSIKFLVWHSFKFHGNALNFPVCQNSSHCFEYLLTQCSHTGRSLSFQEVQRRCTLRDQVPASGPIAGYSFLPPPGGLVPTILSFLIEEQRAGQHSCAEARHFSWNRWRRDKVVRPGKRRRPASSRIPFIFLHFLRSRRKVPSPEKVTSQLARGKIRRLRGKKKKKGQLRVSAAPYLFQRRCRAWCSGCDTAVVTRGARPSVSLRRPQRPALISEQHASQLFTGIQMKDSLRELLSARTPPPSPLSIRSPFANVSLSR